MPRIDSPHAAIAAEQAEARSHTTQTLWFRYRRALIAAAALHGNALEGRNCYWRKRVEKRGLECLAPSVA